MRSALVIVVLAATLLVPQPASAGPGKFVVGKAAQAGQVVGKGVVYAGRGVVRLARALW